VISGRRVFCLVDDAMISMTYARNLVEGHGLTWARFGPPVEGFTHPLWTALMVPVNLLPLPLDRRSLVVQAASLLLLLLHLLLVRQLMRRHFSFPEAGLWLPACLLTALYYPLNYWALMGMETGLQAVLTTALVLLALDIAHLRRARQLALWSVGTLAMLLRLDMAPLVAAALIYSLAPEAPEGPGVPAAAASPPEGHGAVPTAAAPARPAERHGAVPAPPAATPQPAPAGPLPASTWRQHLPGAALMLAAVGGYALFRRLYFHDWLPNTYYLKLTGIPLAVRLLRGQAAMAATWREHAPLLLAVGLGLAAQMLIPSRRRDHRWERRLVLPAAMFLLCCAYSVYVGGDVWEGDERANRFVAFALPQVFVLFNALLNQALSALAQSRQRHRLARAAAAAATLLALLAADGLLVPVEAADHWQDLAVTVAPFGVHDHERILRRVRRLQRLADPGATVAVVWAGIPAYFSDFRLVDELGYNDRHIAHGAPAVALARDNWREYRPGHVKWDYAYVIDQLHPDVIFQLWEETREGGHAIVRQLRAAGYRRVGDLWVIPASPFLHLAPARARP
jgi:hypothetical protein